MAESFPETMVVEVDTTRETEEDSTLVISVEIMDRVAVSTEVDLTIDEVLEMDVRIIEEMSSFDF